MEEAALGPPPTDPPGLRARVRPARDADRGSNDTPLLRNAGKRSLRVSAGLLWTPNNEIPAAHGGNERRR